MVSRAIDKWVDNVWYGQSLFYWLLLPLSWLFGAAVALRRFAYRRGFARSHKPDVPVIIVGNLTAGGTGKTPVTIWLARRLRRQGYQPGIGSRGYRGLHSDVPVSVTPDSDPQVVGDEPVLLAVRAECPVVVHPDRVAAAQVAVDNGADVIIADDGLQHYRLGRSFEIAVVDGVRGVGNGSLMPAGPLREPLSRLDEADVVMVHRPPDSDSGFLRRASDRRPVDFWLRAAVVARLDGSEISSISEFANRTVHAVAGIGNPERFFRMLESHSMKVYRHPLPDHATIEPVDISFDDELPVLMTEKDAVKCRWLDTRKCWFVPVDVTFAGDGERLLSDHLDKVIGAPKGAAA